MPYPCAHAHKLSFLEHAQDQMYIIYVPRGDFYKMASNQALPGPSTSGVSSPSESPWEVQQNEKVISLCLARFRCCCSASKRTGSLG